MGEYDLAIADLTKAVEKAPNFNSSYRYLADSYHREGRDVEALAIADKAIATMRKDVMHDVYFVRAQIHESLGDREAAISDYRATLSDCPACSGDYKFAREALKRLGAD